MLIRLRGISTLITKQMIGINMNWGDIASSVTKVSPTLGTILEDPAGAVAGAAGALLAILYCFVGYAIFHAVVFKNRDLGTLWLVILAYSSILLAILRMYFGELRKERGHRLVAVPKNPLTMLAGVFK